MTAEFVPAGAGGQPLDATPVAAPVLIEGTGPVQHEVDVCPACFDDDHLFSDDADSCACPYCYCCEDQS